MSKKLLIRLAILFFFIGLNIVLGKAFLSEARVRLNPRLVAMLERYGLLLPQLTVETIKTPKEYEAALEPQKLVAAINQQRQKQGLKPLSWNEALAGAAQDLLNQAAEYEYDFDVFPIDEALPESVVLHNYKYQWVSQSVLVGPLTIDAFIDAWLSEETANEAFKSLATASSRPATTSQKKSENLSPPDPSDIGLAVVVVDSPQYGVVGIALQLLGTPQATSKDTSSDSQVQKKGTLAAQSPSVSFRDIPDDEVIAALNSYRATHNHAPYAVHPQLCEYAQKRVGDLLTFGGLDDHAGFKKDFEGDGEPAALKDYPGSQVGENLAYQFCKNMTTGESFVAETGTSLIEWCFDSSTKGHREAQLSTEFKNVCVRHAKGMYVVEFGS